MLLLCLWTLWMFKSVGTICLPNFYDFLVTIHSECFIPVYSVIPCVLVRLLLLWRNTMIQSKLGRNWCFLNAYNITGHPKGLRPRGEHEESCLMYDEKCCLPYSTLQCLLYIFRSIPCQNWAHISDPTSLNLHIPWWVSSNPVFFPSVLWMS